VRLTREDVDSIRDDWLTDNAIAFWEEYLEHEHLPHYPNAQIVLLRPSMSFMLSNAQDPLSLKSALPDLSKTTHVFLPVNDCRNVELAEGGSHWSLLLVSIIDRVAFHYDSLSAGNLPDARRVAMRLGQLLGGITFRFVNLDDTPQQGNGSDCGVYVCLLMQHLLLRRLLTAHAQSKISMSMKGKEVDARGGRREMLRIIEERRREGERRRSLDGRGVSPGRAGGAKSRSPPRIGDENDPRKSAERDRQRRSESSRR
jgi:sentrin-specific protease 8